jgi:hypothetical protein
LSCKLADDAIVPNAISPQPKLGVPQRLAEVARILSSRDAILHVIEVSFWNGPVEPLEVRQGFGVVFNVPGQVLRELARL